MAADDSANQAFCCQPVAAAHTVVANADALGTVMLAGFPSFSNRSRMAASTSSGLPKPQKPPTATFAPSGMQDAAYAADTIFATVHLLSGALLARHLSEKGKTVIHHVLQHLHIFRGQ